MGKEILPIKSLFMMLFKKNVELTMDRVREKKLNLEKYGGKRRNKNSWWGLLTSNR